MLKYHVNPKTGNPGVCKAKYKCRFGDIEKDHYNTPEEARKAFEKVTESESGVFGSPDSKTTSLKIKTSENFQKIIDDYQTKNPQKKRSSYVKSKGKTVTLDSSEVLKSLKSINNSGDQYFLNDSIKVRSGQNYIEVTAVDAENGEETYFYANLSNGFVFYGDDPQEEARDDLTFHYSSGVIKSTASINEISEKLFELYEDHESKKGKWDSDIESIKFNYVNQGHFEINDALRNNKILSEEYLKILDSISSQDELKDETIVYRGVPHQAVEKYLQSIKEGKGFTDSALISTSVNPHTARNFASKNGYVFQLKLQKGKKCWNLSGDIGNEGEILLPRNTEIHDVEIFEVKRD